MRINPELSPGAGHVALLALSLLAALIYWPAFTGPLVLDDTHVIAPLLTAGGLQHPWLYLVGETGPFGRPLAMATFIANAVLQGDDLRYWKATNLLLHLANGWLVFALLTTLFMTDGRAATTAGVAALCGAGLWLLHPLHVSTVMYLSQRMTLLAALFALSGILLYARGRLAGANTRGGCLAILGAIFVCTPLAAVSKETGLLTPYYLLALEMTVFAAQARPRWLSVTLVATTLVPIVGGLIYVFYDLPGHLLNAYSLRDFTLPERMLTETRILVVYLRWIVAPSRAAMGFYHDDVAIAHGLFAEPATVAATMLLLALLVLAGWWRRRAPLIALGIAIFFIGHALESTVFGLELMFEHRNYLPSVGIILSVCAGACALGRPRTLLLVAVLVAGLFTAVTATTARLWGNAPALYHAFFAAHPQSMRARVTLVEWYVSQRDFDAAFALVAQRHDLTSQLHTLRLRCARDHQAGPQQAAVFAAATHAPFLDSFAQDVILALARASLDGDCQLEPMTLAAAVDAARDRPMPRTRRYRFHLDAALLHQRNGAAAIAAERLRTAMTLAPNDPYPCYLAAEFAADGGDYGEARRLLAAARVRAADNAQDFTAIDAGLEGMLKGH